jgi:hypothetical protein
MTQKDIEKALDFRMGEYKTVYPIPVEYPDVAYTPIIGTSYLKIDYLNTPTIQVQLGTKAADRATGIYQITLNVENNKGSAEATKIITQLKEFFKRGTIASYNGLNVRILGFYLGSYSSEGDYYREVVNIIFRSDISN